MKKFYLFFFLIVTFIAGCEKDNTPIEKEEVFDPNSLEYLLQQYNLLNERKLYTNVINNDEAIFFYGFKDNKVLIKGFERTSKKNIWTYVSKEKITTEITVYSGYGNNQTFKLENPKISRILKIKDNHFVFSLVFLFDNRRYYQDIYFISENTEKMQKGIIDNKLVSGLMRLWYFDAILFYGTVTDLPIFIFSNQGELLYKLTNTEVLESSPLHFINNNNECIYFSSYPFRVFVRYNLKEDKYIWGDDLPARPLKDLPSNIRIDKTTFETIDENFTKCTFNYTTYEGDKKTIAFKIDNNTGKFVQL